LKQASPAELLNVKVDDARLKSKYEVGRMGAESVFILIIHACCSCSVPKICRRVMMLITRTQHTVNVDVQLNEPLSGDR
jgi:hypothetical protein